MPQIADNGFLVAYWNKADIHRSFAFTGCHIHRNWELASQRRLVTNGILWTAKFEVPEAGAPVAFNPASLAANLDNKPAPPVKKPAAAPAK